MAIDYSQKILEVKNLKQHFHMGAGRRRFSVRAVDGVSFDIHKREVFGLVGESGCGKTTTGRTIIKLYNATSGDVYFRGRRIVAGLEEYYQTISLLKKQRQQELQKASYKMASYYATKSKYLQELKAINLQKQQLSTGRKEAILALTEPQRIYEFKRKDLKRNVVLYREDIKFKLALKETMVSDTNETYDEYKARLHQEFEAFIQNYKDQIKDLEPALYDLHERKHKIKQELKKAKKNNDLPLIEEKEKARLAIIDEIKQYLLTRTADNQRKLAQINADYLAKRNTLKTQTKEIKANFKLVVAQLVNERFYQKKQLKQLRHQYIIAQTNLAKATQLKHHHEQLLPLLKEKNLLVHTPKKLQAQKELATKIKTLKNEFKQNPPHLENSLSLDDFFNALNEKINYYDNIKLSSLAKQAEIKDHYEALINEERNKISHAKFDDKLCEDEAQRETRLNKLAKHRKHLSEVLNAKKEALAPLLSAKASNADKELKEQIRQVNKQYNKQIKQIKLKIKNYSSVRNSRFSILSNLQMIFQDPIASLNPRMTVKEIIGEGLRIKGGFSNDEIEQEVIKYLNLVGLHKSHMGRYPHEFSGGQRQRIGIARALINKPEFIIADEPISALDVSIQAQVINLLNQLKEELGLTILFIAHNLSVVKYFCDRIAVMYFGKIVELAPTEVLFARPLHPYTQSLLSAIPEPDPISEKQRKRIVYDPSVHQYDMQNQPAMREVEPGHFVYCSEKEFILLQEQLKQN